MTIGELRTIMDDLPDDTPVALFVGRGGVVGGRRRGAGRCEGRASGVLGRRRLRAGARELPADILGGVAEMSLRLVRLGV